MTYERERAMREQEEREDMIRMRTRSPNGPIAVLGFPGSLAGAVAAIEAREAAKTRVTDDQVERASKAFADATGYYVEFHRGLSSESADKIRKGIRAALEAALR